MRYKSVTEMVIKNSNWKFTIRWLWLKFLNLFERRKRMNINDFAKEVTLEEGGKKSISIAQVKEVLKIVNKLLSGNLYTLIRNL